MIWGLGTGRCGTKSLAIQFGGVHEPHPWLGADAVDTCNGNREARKRILRLLKDRQEKYQAKGMIVDMHQSLVIPEILDVDPEPRFIWLIRNPMDCIASLLAGHGWTDIDDHGRHKWQPDKGWFLDMSRFEKALRYWVEVNTLIRDELNGRLFVAVQTESLRVIANEFPAQYTLTAEEKYQVLIDAIPMYREIIGHDDP